MGVIYSGKTGRNQVYGHIVDNAAFASKPGIVPDGKRIDYDFSNFGETLYYHCIFPHAIDFFFADVLMCFENLNNTQNYGRKNTYFSYDGVYKDLIPSYDKFVGIIRGGAIKNNVNGSYDDIVNRTSKSSVIHSTLVGFNRVRRIELIKQKNLSALNNPESIDPARVEQIMHFFKQGLTDFAEKEEMDFNSSVVLDNSSMEHDCCLVAYRAGFVEGVRRMAWNYGYTGFNIDDIDARYLQDDCLRPVITEAFDCGKSCCIRDEEIQRINKER